MFPGFIPASVGAHCRTSTASKVREIPIADLLAAAKAVGVSILFTGSLPSVGTTARMLTEAVVHECLTNTVRHAGGNELYGLKIDCMAQVVNTF